jgi:hypothetical protein
LDTEEECRRRLHAIGLPGRDINMLMAELGRTNAALDLGMCPWCGEPIAEHKHRAEDAGHGQVWFEYQCECGYMGMRLELES